MISNLGIKSNGVTGIDFGATSVKACIRTQNGLSSIHPNGANNVLSEISICKNGIKPGTTLNGYSVSNIKEELGKIDSNGYILFIT